MFAQLNGLAKAAIFYVLTFGLALTVALLTRGGDGGGAEILSMMTPTVSVLLMLLVVTRDGRAREAWRSLGLNKLGRNSWIPAALLPALVLTVSYAILWRTSYADAGIPTDRSTADLFLNPVFNFAIVFVFSLAEEIGWRGYLLPRLLPLGARRASLLTGLLHGLFHMPLFLLTSFYHSDGNRLITIPLFLLSLTMAGAIYGYLRIITGSVWPAAIAHTTLNVVWNLLNTLTIAGSPLAVEYLAGESGILPLLGYTALAAACLYLLNKRPATAPQPVRPAMTTAATRVP